MSDFLKFIFKFSSSLYKFLDNICCLNFTNANAFTYIAINELNDSKEPNNFFKSAKDSFENFHKKDINRKLLEISFFPRSSPIF